jgi:hypothetical protein
MSALPSSTFDYAALDKEARSEVELSTARIHQLERRTSEALIEIGRHLVAVKEKLEHGRFTEWLTCEFGWTYETARRFMKVAAVFGENTQIVCFAPSALYALASGTVPDEIREEFIERAASGETITHKKVQAELRERKGTAAIIAPTSEPIEVQIDPALWTCVECGQEWPESRKYCSCMAKPTPSAATIDHPTVLPEPSNEPPSAIVELVEQTQEDREREAALEQQTGKRLFEIVGDPRGDIARADRVVQFDKHWEHVIALVNFDTDAVADVVPFSNALRWQIHDVREWLGKLEQSYSRGIRLVSGGNG